MVLVGALWGGSTHDGRTVGYIALGGWWRVVDFRARCGLGAVLFGALWFWWGRSGGGSAHDGGTVGCIALGGWWRVLGLGA